MVERFQSFTIVNDGDTCLYIVAHWHGDVVSIGMVRDWQIHYINNDITYRYETQASQ